MTVFLTPEQVLFLHSRLVKETGGAHGVRDLSMLLLGLGRPQPTFDGLESYPDHFVKAAALMDSLIRDHPFVDGNKRTAIAACALFLRRNSLSLRVQNEEMARFTLACAQSQVELKQIAAWLQDHCVPVRD